MVAIGHDRTVARLRAAADLLRSIASESVKEPQEALHVPDP
jgi:hypothetical protein